MKRSVTAGAAAVVVAAGIGAVGPIAAPSPGPDRVAAAEATPDADLTFATVTRGDLTAEREFRATVSFGDPWTLTTDAAGTVTEHRDIGEIVDFGEVLLRIDDQPVHLAQGAMPMYRELLKVDTRQRDENGDRLALQRGFDVAQLQYFLLEAGFGVGSMDVDGEFGTTTEAAVKEWQTAVGLPATGRVDDTQLVFSPEPVRIAAEARVGDRFESITVNHASSSILVDTSNRDRSAFEVGASVEVEIPNTGSVNGTVTAQEQVTTADGSTIWRTTITADADAGLPGDASTATVTTRSTVAAEVLIVPVGALLALAEGGFAVELATGTGTALVAVEVGEVLDGRAEVRGGLDAGDRVVVVS